MFPALFYSAERDLSVHCSLESAPQSENDARSGEEEENDSSSEEEAEAETYLRSGGAELVS